jgi:hypothetical protein
VKDIQQVLAEKLRGLRECQQQVACLKIVLPLLAEEGDKLPEPEIAAGQREPRGWL